KCRDRARERQSGTIRDKRLPWTIPRPRVRVRRLSPQAGPVRPRSPLTQVICMRPSGRASDALRPVRLEPDFAKYAEGSCLARFGDTHVLCTATVEEKVPPFL